jgi:glycosyltransferase involved in cell wall biosynthesis
MARDVRGPCDTVRDGKSGFLVGDVEGFVDKVIRSSSRDELRRMSMCEDAGGRRRDGKLLDGRLRQRWATHCVLHRKNSFPDKE